MSPVEGILHLLFIGRIRDSWEIFFVLGIFKSRVDLVPILFILGLVLFNIVEHDLILEFENFFFFPEGWQVTQVGDGQHWKELRSFSLQFLAEIEHDQAHVILSEFVKDFGMLLNQRCERSILLEESPVDDG